MKEPNTNVSPAYDEIKTVLAEEAEKLRGIPMIKSRALIRQNVAAALTARGFEVGSITLQWPNITIIATAPGETQPVASNLRVITPTSNL